MNMPQGIGEPIVFTYEIEKEIVTAGGASSDVKRQLKYAGVPSPIQRKVSVCMYEGEINMVIHADGGMITVELYDNMVKMILADRGPGIKDIDQAMKEGWSTASEDARDMGFGAGMGLPNMKKHSDYMDISTEIGTGTTVTMAVMLE